MKLHDYEIEKVIIEMIISNEGFQKLVGDNIFPVYIEKDTKGDAVYYDSEIGDPEMCKMGNVRSVMHFYISAVCTNMDSSNEIIGIIQDIIEGDFKNPYMRIRAVGSTKEGADFKYAKTMDFLIEW